MIQHIDFKRYGCKIILHRQAFQGSEGKLMHYWTGLPFKTYMKFQWYFQYRAALIKVQNPRLFVEICPFQYDHVLKVDEIRKRLTDRQRSAKAKVTEFTNKIELAKRHWNQLFPIEEDDLYKRAMTKLELKKNEVTELQNQIDAL